MNYADEKFFLMPIKYCRTTAIFIDIGGVRECIKMPTLLMLHIIVLRGEKFLLHVFRSPGYKLLLQHWLLLNKIILNGCVNLAGIIHYSEHSLYSKRIHQQEQKQT